MPAKRRLTELLDQVHESNQASRSDCLRMFALARELIEAQSEFDTYPTLRFFADWSLHSKLDRKSARHLIGKIVRVVEEHRDAEPSLIVRGISEALSIGQLHTELLQLFQAHDLPGFLLVQPQPWSQCASWLLQDLIEKPVVGSKFTAEEKRTGWGSTPRVLRLIVDPDDGNQIKWQVELGPRVQMRGRLLKV